MSDELIQVFISYAREDAEAAREIFEFLDKVDEIHPWLDLEELLPGVDWQHSIMRAIKESRFVLVLLSNNSVNKRGYVQKEIAEAIEQYAYFPPGKIFLIPVRLEECKPSHDLLRKLNWVDLFLGWEEGMDKIVRTMNQETGRQATRSKALLAELVSDAEDQLISHDKFGSSEWINYVGEDHKITPDAELIKGIQRKTALSGKQLMHYDMRHQDLSGIDLSGANLVGADLSHSNMKNANLKGANLERANLYMADLDGANLWGANLWGTNLAKVKNAKDASVVNANIFAVEGLSDEEVIFLVEQNIVYLEDYGEFILFYKDKLGMSDVEFRKIFKWSESGMFVKMISMELSKKRVPH